MTRHAWILAAAVVASCHLPMSARAGEGTALTPTEGHAPADDPTRAIGGGTRAKKKPVPLPPLPSGISLCCDRPSGLCYRDSGELCQARTSDLVMCPVDAVRDYDESRGFVVCAD